MSIAAAPAKSPVWPVPDAMLRGAVNAREHEENGDVKPWVKWLLLAAFLAVLGIIQFIPG